MFHDGNNNIFVEKSDLTPNEDEDCEDDDTVLDEDVVLFTPQASSDMSSVGANVLARISSI